MSGLQLLGTPMITNFATFACGNCVYYAMWQRFPPISSWVVIIPCWFLALSSIRTFRAARLSGIPPLYVAAPLVLAVAFFAPGVIGPPLGFWIPICCAIGTWAGLARTQPKNVKAATLVVSAIVTIALVAFGAYDLVTYYQMPEAERQRFIPVWEAKPIKQRGSG